MGRINDFPASGGAFDGRRRQRAAARVLLFAHERRPGFMSASRAPGAATRRFLGAVRPMLIDGRWHASDSPPCAAVDPASGEVIGHFAPGGPAEVDAAVDAARRAFEARRWTGLAGSARARILWRIAELIEQHADTLAELETLDGGKLLQDARQGDVVIAAEAFRYHAGWCTKLAGEALEPALAPSGEYHCYTRREPLGVAALIVPWNGPLAIACWKLAPALAAGCSAIVKPPEQASLSLLYFGELLLESGLPPGVVNIVTGTGESVGQALAAHRGVDKVSFTGSTATGRKVLHAAAGNFKRLTLELGGKSPAIVFADADLERAAAGVAQGIFANAGQVCVASSRLYAERCVFDELLERVVAHARALRLGPGMDPASEMGPLISAEHLARVEGHARNGIAAGATPATGGRRLDRPGFFFEPTVMIDAAADSPLMRSEVFGPVICALPFDGIDAALRAANECEFGLAGSVWTQDVRKAHRVAAAVRAGLLWVNEHGRPDVAIAFGGFGASGWEREQGRQSVESFTELKSVMVRL